MYMLSWRKTNFLCIISILSRQQMSKLINVNCLHFIGCQNYINVFINHVLYQNSSHCSTTILSKYITSDLTAFKDHVIKYSETSTVLAIVMSIIFSPLITLPRTSKSCDFGTFGVLRYLLSTFLLYTPHCLMVLTKQKCCFLSTGVSTESKTYLCTSVKAGFLATRNMTFIIVGLARSYVKLLLSSWTTYN